MDLGLLEVILGSSLGVDLGIRVYFWFLVKRNKERSIDNQDRIKELEDKFDEERISNVKLAEALSSLGRSIDELRVDLKEYHKDHAQDYKNLKDEIHRISKQ